MGKGKKQRTKKEPWELPRPKPPSLPAPPPPPPPAEPLVTGPQPDLANLTLEDLLRVTGALIMFDPGRLYRTDGTPVALDELDLPTRLAIQAIEVSEEYDYEDKARINTGVLKKIRQYDRIRATELYAELKGWRHGEGSRGNKINLLREYLAAVREGNKA